MNNQESNQVQISRTDLTRKVNEGWKKKELANFYNVPVTQMTEILKEAGLRIRSLQKKRAVLVDDTNQTNVVQQNVVQEEELSQRNTPATEVEYIQEEIQLEEAQEEPIQNDFQESNDLEVSQGL